MNNPSNDRNTAARQARIALAQISMTVGDVPGNTRRIVETAHRARERMQAQLVIASVEGGLILARLNQSKKPLHEVATLLGQLK